MIRFFDCIVVGAGPIGGYLSKKLNENGHSVLLLEEHDEIGRPFQCAGLVNPAAMETIGLESSILPSIWGANIHSPSGKRVSIGDPKGPRTFSVCRKVFDEAVVMQSIATGTDYKIVWDSLMDSAKTTGYMPNSRENCELFLDSIGCIKCFLSIS